MWEFEYENNRIRKDSNLRLVGDERFDTGNKRKVQRIIRLFEAEIQRIQGAFEEFAGETTRKWI